jgi:hypothetical protein
MTWRGTNPGQPLNAAAHLGERLHEPILNTSGKIERHLLARPEEAATPPEAFEYPAHAQDMKTGASERTNANKLPAAGATEVWPRLLSLRGLCFGWHDP